MGMLKRETEKITSTEEHRIDSAICMDCEWDGLLTECTETDSDEDFNGNQIEIPICPKCGGGLDDYYPSTIH